jgi:hypothetical protein
MMEILLATQEVGTFKAYAKVLGMCEGKNIYHLHSGDDLSDRDSRCVVLLAGFDQNELSRLLWEEIRSKYCNPIIVIGGEREDVFCMNNPAFRGGTAKYHKYLVSYCSLTELLRTIDIVQPLYDDDTRKLIYERYGTPVIEDRLYRLLSHDLKMVDKKKDLLVLRDALNLSVRIAERGLEDKIRAAMGEVDNSDPAVIQTHKEQLLAYLMEKS